MDVTLNGTIELVFPAIEHKQAVMDYRQEHFDCGEMEIHGDGGLDHAGSYEEWLERVQTDLTRETEEYVPATTLLAMLDGKIVGILQVRHKLNEGLFSTGGHIGYGVRPSERQKGYGTKMLALALVKCREMGIKKALVTCDKDNAGSAKVILYNGGVYENESAEEDGTPVNRYWIDTTGM